MARQSEVFVRALEPEEAQRLVKIPRTTKDRIRLRRAGIVLASFQRRSAMDAAAMFAASPQYVREVIHAFNEQGFAALDPKNGAGGRPPKFGPLVRELVCRVAKTHPSNSIGRSRPGVCPSSSSTWLRSNGSRSTPRRCDRSCVRQALRGRRRRRGRPVRPRSSCRRWAASSICTITRRPMGVWSVPMSSGR